MAETTTAGQLEVGQIARLGIYTCDGKLLNPIDDREWRVLSVEKHYVRFQAADESGRWAARRGVHPNATIELVAS